MSDSAAKLLAYLEEQQDKEVAEMLRVWGRWIIGDEVGYVGTHQIEKARKTALARAKAMRKRLGCRKCGHVYDPAPECPKCGHDKRDRLLEPVAMSALGTQTRQKLATPTLNRNLVAEYIDKVMASEIKRRWPERFAVAYYEFALGPKYNASQDECARNLGMGKTKYRLLAGCVLAFFEGCMADIERLERKSA